MQLLREEIPKVQKDTDNLTVFLHFWDLQAWKLLVKCWLNWLQDYLGVKVENGDDIVKCRLCPKDSSIQDNIDALYIHLTKTHFRDRLLKGIPPESKLIRYVLHWIQIAWESAIVKTFFIVRSLSPVYFSVFFMCKSIICLITLLVCIFYIRRVK